MHQVIGEELAVLGAEPAQSDPDQRQPRRNRDPGRQERRDDGHAQEHHDPQPPGHQHAERQLQQQHPHRVERGDDRPLAQPHQPEQRAGKDIGRGRPDQLQVGRRDGRGHAVAHDIGPDQHLDIGIAARALDLGLHVPAIGALGRPGAQTDLIAGNLRLYGGFLAVQLAVAPRMNRVVAGDVEDPAPCHGGRAAHLSASVCLGKGYREMAATLRLFNGPRGAPISPAWRGSERFRAARTTWPRTRRSASAARWSTAAAP